MCEPGPSSHPGSLKRGVSVKTYHYAIFMRSVKIKEPVLSKAAPVVNDMHTHFLLTQQTAQRLVQNWQNTLQGVT